MSSSSRPQIQKLISIIEPVLEADGFELVELRFLLEQGGWTLRVCVDMPLDDNIPAQEVPPERVDLSDCETISRELSAVLDVDDVITQAYSLEVSSPGIERPLRTARHFAYYVNSEAKIQMAVGVTANGGSERKNFRGLIRGVEGDQVVLFCDGAEYRLPIDDIDHAKIVPDWDAVMKGGSGAGGPIQKPAKPGGKVSPKRQNAAKN